MDITLNIKVYHTKKLFEVNLHDVRKNTTPISQKTEVHFLRYLTPNMDMSSFSNKGTPPTLKSRFSSNPA